MRRTGIRNSWGLLAGGLALAWIALPTRAGDIEMHSPKDIPMHRGEEVEILRSPGVDAVSPQGPLDSQIVGRWSIDIPATQVEGKVSPGGSMGVLVIDAQGNYAWRSQGRPLATGTVQQVQPRRDAQAGKTYWLVSNGDAPFYLTSDPHGLTLYSLRTNSYVATGTPI